MPTNRRGTGLPGPRQGGQQQQPSSLPPSVPLARRGSLRQAHVAVGAHWAPPPRGPSGPGRAFHLSKAAWLLRPSRSLARPRRSQPTRLRKGQGHFGLRLRLSCCSFPWGRWGPDPGLHLSGLLPSVGCCSCPALKGAQAGPKWRSAGRSQRAGPPSRRGSSAAAAAGSSGALPPLPRFCSSDGPPPPHRAGLRARAVKGRSCKGNWGQKGGRHPALPLTPLG